MIKQYAYNKQTEIELEDEDRLIECVPGKGNPVAYNTEIDNVFIEVIFLKWFWLIF